MSTPYETHATLNHQMTRYSPSSVDIIEECECGQRWIHNPSIGYPVTLQTTAELNARREQIARETINAAARARLERDRAIGEGQY